MIDDDPAVVDSREGRKLSLWKAGPEAGRSLPVFQIPDVQALAREIPVPVDVVIHLVSKIRGDRSDGSDRYGHTFTVTVWVCTGAIGNWARRLCTWESTAKAFSVVIPAEVGANSVGAVACLCKSRN